MVADPNSSEFGENRQGGSAEPNRTGAGLAVGQEEKPAFKIDVIPFESQNFIESATREQQQPDRCDRVRGNSRAPILRLWCVLAGRAGVVDLVRQTLGLGERQRLAQPRDLSIRQITGAGLFLESSDVARRIGAARNLPSLAGPTVERRDQRYDAIGGGSRPAC